MSGTTRRILIADDDDAVRQAFQDALEPRRGQPQGLTDLEEELFGKGASAKAAARHYELNGVAQGEDAVAAVARSLSDGKPFGVVFLDMRMPPGIDGCETAKQIRALDPTINIVLVTGYSDTDVDDVAAQVQPADKLFFIAKPFQVAEIRQQAAALSARWSHENALVLELKTQNRSLQDLAAEARQAQSDAERANVAKSVFLANVSHELRTPLNSIIGFSDMMVSELYGPLGDERYVDFSREINNSGIGLLGAINDVIDTARLDIGKVELVREEFELKDFLEKLVVEFDNLAARKNVTLALAPPAPRMRVTADRKRLHQILFGIVDNAIKFSPGNGRVNIAAETRGGESVILVRDEGPGMSAELAEAVRHPFAQADNEYSREHGGLGLGLSLAMRLVELHAGRLGIDSAPGRGTTVSVHLPATSSSANAA